MRKIISEMTLKKVAHEFSRMAFPFGMFLMGGWAQSYFVNFHPTE